MSSSEGPACNTRRRGLFTAVSALCFEAGFVAAEKPALETLTEMLQSCITEIGNSSRAFCELTGRTKPLVGDVVVALVEMGLDVDSLPGYAKRPNRVSLPAPPSPPRPPTPKILQAGEKRPLPNYIPEHYPQFPDPHAYIRTPTHKQPVTEYEAIREKAASQKRDVERALTRFVAKTGATQSLLLDDTSLFPLIACKPTPNPYLSALLAKDQIFEDDDDENKMKKSKMDKSMGEQEQTEGKTDNSSDLEFMDNPYLRPVKMPRKRKK